jgi:hypothetical protein
MLPFVLDGHNPPINQLADKVRVEPLFGILEPEGRGLLGQVAYPPADGWMGIEMAGAQKFLGGFAVGFFLAQFTRLRTKIVLFELVSSLVEPTRLVTRIPKIKGPAFGNRQGGILWQPILEGICTFPLAVAWNQVFDFISQAEPVQGDTVFGLDAMHHLPEASR